MSTKKLANVSLSEYRDFLSKVKLTRPIIFQTHIEPVPEFIIRNALRALGISKDQFWEIVAKK